MSPIPCLQWFNSAGLDLKPPGSFGTLGRGILREPGMFAWDMGAFKKISLTGDRVNVQFRARFFNIFNHPRVLPTIAMSGAGFWWYGR